MTQLSGLKSARGPTIPPESERQFQAAVLQLARLHRWAAYYVHDSRHSPAGWPDLILLRPPRAVAAELKREDGIVRVDQDVCLALLAACGIESYIWRPSQKQEIAEILR